LNLFQAEISVKLKRITQKTNASGGGLHHLGIGLYEIYNE